MIASAFTAGFRRYPVYTEAKFGHTFFCRTIRTAFAKKAEKYFVTYSKNTFFNFMWMTQKECQPKYLEKFIELYSFKSTMSLSLLKPLVYKCIHAPQPPTYAVNLLENVRKVQR